MMRKIGTLVLASAVFFGAISFVPYFFVHTFSSIEAPSIGLPFQYYGEAEENCEFIPGGGPLDELPPPGIVCKGFSSLDFFSDLLVSLAISILLLMVFRKTSFRIMAFALVLLSVLASYPYFFQ